MKKICIFLSIPLILSACGLISQKTPDPQEIATSAIPSTTSSSFNQLPETPSATFTQPSLFEIPTSVPSSTSQKICGPKEPGSGVYIDEFPSVAIREGPGCDYPDIQEQINKWDPIMWFEMLGVHNDWLLVDFCNDLEGWVFSPAIAGSNISDESLDALSTLNPPPKREITPTEPPSGEPSLGKARETVINFYDNLSNKNYEEATKLFAGGYGITIMWNSDVDPQDYPTLLMKACERNGFECFVKIRRIVSEEQISSMEYHFIVEFSKEDGSIYQRRGPQDALVSQFLIRVARDCDGKYYVVTWPFYEQYGG